MCSWPPGFNASEAAVEGAREGSRDGGGSLGAAPAHPQCSNEKGQANQSPRKNPKDRGGFKLLAFIQIMVDCLWLLAPEEGLMNPYETLSMLHHQIVCFFKQPKKASPQLRWLGHFPRAQSGSSSSPSCSSGSSICVSFAGSGWFSPSVTDSPDQDGPRKTRR